MSFYRRIIALVAMLLGSTFGGLLAVAFADSRLAAIVGVVLGAVAGMVRIVIYANQSLRGSSSWWSCPFGRRS